MSRPRKTSDLVGINSFCQPESWRSSLFMGSVLTWMLGVIIFGLSVAMMKKPIFEDELMPLLDSLYQGLGAAVAASIMICVLAVLGCCGAAIKAPKLLFAYVIGLGILFLYQLANGSALIYYGHEKLTVLQFLSIEVCKQTRLGETPNPINSSLSRVADRVSRVLRESSDLNQDIAKMMKTLDDVLMNCPPIKDYVTPIGSLLLACAISYFYLGGCSLLLARFYSKHLICNREEPNGSIQMENVSQQKSPSSCSTSSVEGQHIRAYVSSCPATDAVTTPRRIDPPAAHEGTPASYVSAVSSVQRELKGTPRPRPQMPLLATAVAKLTMTPSKVPTIIVQIPTPRRHSTSEDSESELKIAEN